MPELPEVEALVRYLDSATAGSVVERCQLAQIAALKTFDPPLDALSGTTVEGWRRQGKYLCLRTSGPWLVLHLARGGWVRWWDNPPKAPARPGGSGPLALRLVLQGGRGLDVTEMGTEKRVGLWAVRQPEDVPGLATLGPDALDDALDMRALGRLLAGEPGTLKTALSRQSLIAGIGNAYSDEILHAARLSPYKPAAKLVADELAQLHAAVKGVLGDAVDRAVGLVAAELKADKKRTMRVHGRTGEACPVCGDVVREVSFATRSLQYCATCQTAGRPLADRRLSRLLK
ncbi:MAG: Fpg/Nei family DNA glycosylase [Acidimicrobiales bacterium]